MTSKYIYVVALSFVSSIGVASTPKQAKNIIFFLGDGMGPATVTSTRIYTRGEAGQLRMETLPRTAKIKTYSLDAQTTDSAPSMSAYMTGVKMRNDVISMSADTIARVEANGHCSPTNGKSVETILELAKSVGRKVGVVTTTELTHATPAATYAHICHRDLAFDIAAQAVPGGVGFNSKLRDGVDVLFGGGANHWTPMDAMTNPQGRSDQRDLLSEMKRSGYSVVRSAAELRELKISGEKIIGLFSANSHLSYEVERDNHLQPSLAEMTEQAIRSLQRASDTAGQVGYFLMVEGGRIDHALHQTDAHRAVIETAAFDDAIETALKLADLEETLIIVTADHDHTMTINGYGQRGRGDHLLDVVRSAKDGTPLLDADGFAYPTLVFGNGPHRPNQRSASDTHGVQQVGFYHLTAVRLRSETHGGGDVMFMAGGVGSELFGGTLDNTAVFDRMKRAVGF